MNSKGFRLKCEGVKFGLYFAQLHFLIFFPYSEYVLFLIIKRSFEISKVVYFLVLTLIGLGPPGGGGVGRGTCHDDSQCVQST